MRTSCTKEFRKRALILYTKGFGFQPPGTGITDVFIICFCKNLLTDTELSNINKMAKCISVKSKMWQSQAYLEIHWSEHDKIPQVFNSLLKMGISFRLHNKLCLTFDPEFDSEFSIEIMEQKAIDHYSKLEYNVNSKMVFDNVLFDVWNWKTTRGKKYCRHLRSLRNLPEIGSNHSSNYFNWDEFKGINLQTLNR